MSAKLKIKRGTTSAWESTDASIDNTLEPGQLGVEYKDNGNMRLKVGKNTDDGSATKWTDLPYTAPNTDVYKDDSITPDLGEIDLGMRDIVVKNFTVEPEVTNFVNAGVARCAISLIPSLYQRTGTTGDATKYSSPYLEIEPIGYGDTSTNVEYTSVGLSVYPSISSNSKLGTSDNYWGEITTTSVIPPAVMSGQIGSSEKYFYSSRIYNMHCNNIIPDLNNTGISGSVKYPWSCTYTTTLASVSQIKGKNTTSISGTRSYNLIVGDDDITYLDNGTGTTHKNIEIKPACAIKATSTGSTFKNSPVFTFTATPSGMSFYPDSGQESFLGTSERPFSHGYFTDLNVNGNSLSDFIVAQGTAVSASNSSYTWNYRKWKSGKYEAWILFEVGHVDVTTLTGSAIYVSNSITPPQPPTAMTTIECVQQTFKSNWGDTWAVADGGSGLSPFKVACAYSNNQPAASYSMYYYVIGKFN